ncbi:MULTISPECIES: anti-repressor SinI family protein [Priestia]|nr:anti-repressor SinI family protein [Priestia aryabhattai]MBY0214410.1 anti-repressor SinI family protein [Priestia aryabhattai]MDT0148422.1 anti-repressor SinI family protein [Priestia aryabhattai]MDT0153712.1 anti-repressor SinI family protein [Priestia aryabhattai]
MSSSHQSLTRELDEEWVSLIREAKEMKLSIEEIKEFLKNKKIL